MFKVRAAAACAKELAINNLKFAFLTAAETAEAFDKVPLTHYYLYVCMYVCMYVYIYRERERERETVQQTHTPGASRAVGRRGRRVAAYRFFFLVSITNVLSSRITAIYL